MKLATFDAGQGPQTGIVVGDLIIPIAPSLPEIGTDRSQTSFAGTCSAAREDYGDRLKLC